MSQRNAKIRDALKTEYTDFVDFCVSLDKQFISELTTSDFIAFRTQYGATRDYIACIRQALESYDINAATQENDVQDGLPDEKITTEKTKDSSFSLEKMATEEMPIDKTLEEASEKVGPSAFENLEENTISAKESSKIRIFDINDSKTQPFSGTPEEPKRIISSTKPWMNNLEELQTMDLELPLYDLFGISPNPIFNSKDVDELDLSVRPYNCLRNNHCNTIDALFKKNLREIGEFSNLGPKSLLEILKKCKEIASSHHFQNDSAVTETASLGLAAIRAKEKVLAVAESIALGIEYDMSDLSDVEKNYICLLEEAYQTLGEDLCLMALEEPDKARNICAMLNKSIELLEVHSQTVQYINNLASHGISLELHVKPFVTAINRKTEIDLNTVFTDNDHFNDITSVVEKYLVNNPESKAALLNSLQVFTNEVSNGIAADIARAYEKAVTSDRVLVVLQLRQEGHTLAEVGNLLHLTRERVRQLESKAIRLFSISLKHTRTNVIGYIHALLDGDLMIHKEEMASYITDRNHLDLLWACIINDVFDCDAYNYQKQYDAIVFKQDNAGIEEKIVNGLPSFIFKDELEELIQHVVKEKGAWEEKIRIDIKRRYKVYGSLYSERRPTVVFICDWVLKNRFANGFKVNDETDAKRFLDYIRDVFGEESSHMTPRALDAKVSSVGILCDRGKYIHPSMVTIDYAILDEIDQYIQNSPKNAITYIELFETFKEKLAGSQISNHYFLQGVLKQYGNTTRKRINYYLYRDYVTKDENVSPTDELEAFVKERGTVHKSEIFAEFPALNEITIGQVAARCPGVFNIDGGNYIHASQFRIWPVDYPYLRKYLTEETKELPANIRKIYDDCSIRFSEFMERNELYNRDLLFAVLNYMFRDEFRFNKPYIAKSDDIELTNRGVTLSILALYDEIAIDELMDLLDERGIQYASLPNLLQMVSPEYIRVDENLLMKRALTGIDDDVEEEALNILSDAIEVNGYLPSCEVLDFIWYPSIDVTWTPYLLESIVLSSDRIDYVPYSYSRSHRSLVVYVSKKYAGCDFQSLLLKIIGEEYDKGTFTKKSDMREWLIEAGFVDVKLPNFLESAQYYYMGDDGRLVRREEAEQ